jgi:hypothetical protein
MGKVICGIAGTLLVGVGLYLGLSLSGILGDSDKAISGLLGGSLPTLCGLLGGVAFTFAFTLEEDEGPPAPGTYDVVP